MITYSKVAIVSQGSIATCAVNVISPAIRTGQALLHLPIAAL